MTKFFLYEFLIMNTTKKLMQLLLSLLAMTACHDDELNGEEYCRVLFEYSTNGI